MSIPKVKPLGKVRRPKRNADGRQPIETIFGKAIRSVEHIQGHRQTLLIFRDSRSRVIFTCYPHSLFDEQGMLLDASHLPLTTRT